MNVFYKIALVGSAALCALIVGWSLIPDSSSTDRLAQNEGEPEHRSQEDSPPLPDSPAPSRGEADEADDPPEPERGRPTLADRPPVPDIDLRERLADEDEREADVATSEREASRATANANASIDQPDALAGRTIPAPTAPTNPNTPTGPGTTAGSLNIPDLDTSSSSNPRRIVNFNPSGSRDAGERSGASTEREEPEPDATADASRRSQSDDDSYTMHTVERGETVSSIAAQTYGHERHWQTIARANPTIDPDRIREGQEIRLPSPDSVRSAELDEQVPERPEGTMHTVQLRESLYSIAREHYGDPNDWRRIYEANRETIGQSPDRLRAGMELVIP